MPPERVGFRHGDGELAVSYRAQRDGSFTAAVDEHDYLVTVQAINPDSVDLEINGRRVDLLVARDGDLWLLHGAGGGMELRELPRFPASAQAEFTGGLVAPMPGNVTATHVEEGAVVELGQLLLILEAMKMEHRITAPVAGTIKQMRVSVGDQVDNGELLVVLEAAES